MENKITERNGNEKVVTVIMGSDFTPEEKHDFRCHNCGRIVFNYYSEVRIIILGEMREVSRPTDIMCSRCKIIYRIA